MITQIDKKAALVFIDLQKGTTDSLPAENRQRVVRNAERLQKAFRQTGQTIVIVHVDPTGALFTRIRTEASQKKPAKDAPSAHFTELLPEITVRENDILITKHVWNAFFETNLHRQLRQKGITQLILAGVSTSIGVEGTARAAAELGYNLIFATDAMTDTIPESQTNSLIHIFPRLGELGATEHIIRLIEDIFF
ncbi:MAG: isochorismatase family protein [Tannerellaceae bacterium]|nr:isochorismatase family protein [Tannerellaceae bacterium]